MVTCKMLNFPFVHIIGQFNIPVLRAFELLSLIPRRLSY